MSGKENIPAYISSNSKTLKSFFSALLLIDKQTSLTFDDKQIVEFSDKTASVFSKKVELIKDRNFVVTESELEKHKKFIETINNAIWKKHF